MEETTPASEPSFDKAVASFVSELPNPIQEFLRSPERDQIAIRLSQKYGLHVDQAGIFQLAYLHMLIGVASPEEFSITLKDAGIPVETVSKLIYDVNEEVFKPLRAKEQEFGTTTPDSAATIPVPVELSTSVATPTQSDRSKTLQAPKSYAGERPQPLTPFNLPGTEGVPEDLFRSSTRSVAHVPETPAMAGTPTTLPPRLPINRIPHDVKIPPISPLPTAELVSTAHSTPSVLPKPVMPAPFAPQKTASYEPATLGGTLRTMATDMLAVNEHREPEPVLYKGTSYVPPLLSHEAPPPKTQYRPAAHLANTPMEGPKIPAQEPGPARTKTTPLQPHDLITEYSIDPYRESV